MAGHENSPDFEQASSTLDEGLKSCRAVLQNYRELLVGDHLVAAPIADNDDQPTAGYASDLRPPLPE
ncbi:MAG TPA: hypothetical protein VF079_07575 [Sphingomicrobium sp.]